mgnify:CR=1 FL=1
MKALVVRVHKAEVWSDNRLVSSIGGGIVVFIGIDRKDTYDSLVKIAEKVANLRIFEDDKGKLQFSVRDKNYAVMCVSNFTLCANTEKGRRPSFEKAMMPSAAEKLYNNFIMVLESKGIKVEKGIFGVHMDIKLEMDGPVNIVIEE